MDALFTRFRAIYGRRFDDLYVDADIIEEAKREWAEALGASMSGERIKIGIDKCKRELAWPPSIAEFMERAKSPAAAHRQYKALPPVRPGKQVGHQACRTMRDILAGHEIGDLVPEHRAMLEHHNPDLLARIDQRQPGVNTNGSNRSERASD